MSHELATTWEILLKAAVSARGSNSVHADNLNQELQRRSINTHDYIQAVRSGLEDDFQMQQLLIAVNRAHANHRNNYELSLAYHLDINSLKADISATLSFLR